ncbi:hypothetical protein SKAU_G00318270 [Synaphobranchus kaupii]|uniref:Uncharacterized protein n=1 Tax=Synaphobranchus kaupii TaxID=118154 RepID=A0A9Q1ET02_SYNKA|nr:hypothetical protein SKAU_G00318270 [Synaphobranchus kaupii]
MVVVVCSFSWTEWTVTPFGFLSVIVLPGPSVMKRCCVCTHHKSLSSMWPQMRHWLKTRSRLRETSRSSLQRPGSGYSECRAQRLTSGPAPRTRDLALRVPPTVCRTAREDAEFHLPSVC